MSQTVQRKKHTRVILVVVLMCGLAAGYLTYYLFETWPILIPAEHRNVASMITIQDYTKQRYLTLKYLGSGQIIPGFLSEADQFPPGHTYKSSKWAFYIDNDVEAYMTVSGPGLDGASYGVEISRCCWDELKISAPTGTYDFPGVSALEIPSIGYLSLVFIP